MFVTSCILYKITAYVCILLHINTLEHKALIFNHKEHKSFYSNTHKVRKDAHIKMEGAQGWGLTKHLIHTHKALCTS